MASITALVDDFTTKNTALWSWDAAAAVTSGRLQIPCSTSYSAITSAASYDLTNASIFCQAVQMPNRGADSTSAVLMCGKDLSNGFLIRYVAGNLRFIEMVSNSESNATSLAYSATDHAWWRIRHAAGTIYWETSPDGSAWTIRRQKAPASANATVTAQYVRLQTGYSGTESSPGALIVDNINVAPAPVGKGAFFSFFDLAGADEPGAQSAPTARLGWLDPRYFVVGMGTQTIDTAPHFAGLVDSYSLVGAPAGVSVNPATGVISVTAATAFDWTTVGVRAANAGGFAEATIDLWCFTPSKTVASGAAWSTVTPAAGDIVVIRGGTYSARQSVAGWSGTASAKTRVVAYPGETVTFNCPSETGYYIETNNVSNLELRGFKLVDSNGHCNFGLWNNVSSNITIAQCEISGFKKASLAFGQGTRANAGPLRVEYCRLRDNVQENKNNAMGSGGWSGGMTTWWCDGSVIRRNRVYQNWGEGFVFLGCKNFTVTDNVAYDNWSVNMYLDNCRDFEVHGNTVFSTNPTYFWNSGGQGAADSIRAANENYANADLKQSTSGLMVTANRIHASNTLPSYRGDYGNGGGAGTSMFTPNSTFTTVEVAWK